MGGPAPAAAPAAGASKSSKRATFGKQAAAGPGMHRGQERVRPKASYIRPHIILLMVRPRRTVVHPRALRVHARPTRRQVPLAVRRSHNPKGVNPLQAASRREGAHRVSKGVVRRTAAVHCPARVWQEEQSGNARSIRERAQGRERASRLRIPHSCSAVTPCTAGAPAKVQSTSCLSSAAKSPLSFRSGPSVVSSSSAASFACDPGTKSSGCQCRVLFG